MHLLPVAIQLLPDPCFAAAGCHGISFHQLLREARIANHDGIVTQPPQVWTRHGHIHRRCRLAGVSGKFEVVTMERQTFHEMPFALCFKAADVVGADSRVGRPIPGGTPGEQALMGFRDLKIAPAKSHPRDPG